MSDTKVVQAVEESVELGVTEVTTSHGNVLRMIQSLAQIGELIPPWWSVARDNAIRNAWKDGGYLSGFMNLGRSKLTSIPITVEAKNTNVTAHVQQAELMTLILNSASQYGEGLVAAMDKGSEDYLGTDNGMFLEVVADGPKDQPIAGPVLSIIHRDSLRCTRTGDPIWPMVYVDRDGKSIPYHWTRIIMMSENRSADDSMYGVGYCSMSRLIKLSHGAMSALNYRLEQMGVRPVNRIIVGDGIEGAEILQAIMAAQGMMGELGLENFVNTVAIGGQGIKLEKIDLNRMEEFDERAIVEFTLHAMAFIAGVEPNEVLQITGSKSSDEVALQRGRSKLPQRFIENFLPQSWKIVPPHLILRMDYQDDYYDQQRALIEDIKARNRSRNLDSGVTTPGVERRRMYDDKIVTREEFMAMQLDDFELEDGTPVQSLFFNPRYASLFHIPHTLLVPSANDPVEAKTMVEANIAAVYGVMGTSSSAAVKRMAQEALSALTWLNNQYMIPTANGDGEEEVEEEEEEEEDTGRVSEKSFFSSSKTLRRLSLT